MSSNAEVQRIFNDALVKPTEDLIYVPTKEEEEETRCFIIQSKSYYDLQAYVAIGLRLPDNQDRFHATYPQHQLSALHKLDGNAYNEVRNAMLNISEHAAHFQKTGMYGFQSVTTEVLGLTDTMTQILVGPFKSSLDWLETVETSGWTRKTKVESQRLANCIQTVSASVAKRENACNELVNTLTLYQGQTASDKLLVDGIYKKFIHPGPGYGQKPFSEALQGGLAGLRREASDAADRYQREVANYNHYTTVAATSPSYAWLWPFGTIAAASVAGVYGDKAVKAKSAYEAAKATLTSKSEEIRGLTRCIDLVTDITAQITTIASTIEKAIDAVGALKAMFARMASGLKRMSDLMESFKKSASPAEEFVFVALLQTDYDMILSKWSEVRTLATTFLIHKHINWQAAEAMYVRESESTRLFKQVQHLLR